MAFDRDLDWPEVYDPEFDDLYWDDHPNDPYLEDDSHLFDLSYSLYLMPPYDDRDFPDEWEEDTLLNDQRLDAFSVGHSSRQIEKSYKLRKFGRHK